MTRYRVNESNIKEDFERLNKLISDLEVYNLIHDEKADQVDRLMGEWLIESFPEGLDDLREEYEALDDEEAYDGINEWLMSYISGNWWFQELERFSDEQKTSIFHRFRDTLFYCMYSDTWDDDAVRARIDAGA